MHNKAFFSYAAKYEYRGHTIVGMYQPLHPQEKYLVGIVGRPSKRLNLFAELKAGPDGKTDFLSGFRAKFMEGMITGTLSSSGKATSVYKRYIEMLELTLTGQQDFTKPMQPVMFGLSLQVGGM